jgi:uncharacterized repeat protein (TIGR03803 family)
MARHILSTVGATCLLALATTNALAADALHIAYSFGPKEADPRAELTLAPNNMMYGTTYSQSEPGYGTVFSYNSQTHVKTTLHAFQPADGAYPIAGVTLAKDGNLYGVTQTGGPPGGAGLGTIYKVNPTTKAFTVLYTFTGMADGENPAATLLLDKTGTILYGSTEAVYAPGGTIFKFDIATGKLTTIYTFKNGADGNDPYNAKFAWDSTGTILYGTSRTGGTNHGGVLYEFDTKSRKLTPLHEFTNAVDGWALDTGVTLDSKGVIYGTADYGGGADDGNNFGTLYKYDTKTEKFTLLHAFRLHEDGGAPWAGVTFDAKGNLFVPLLSGRCKLQTTCGGAIYEYKPSTNKGSIAYTFPTNTGDKGLGYLDTQGRLAFQAPNHFWGTFWATPLDFGNIYEFDVN